MSLSKRELIDLKEVTLTCSSTIKDAIEKLNKSRLKTAYILENNGKLIGSINDGDLRRSYYKNKKLTDYALSISNRAPIVASEHEPKNVYRSKIQLNNLYSLPIVDENFKLINIIFNSALIIREHKSTPVLIMAGGFGKRLGELTAETPKPMIKVGGVPIIQHIIQNLSGLGYKNFYISIHFQAEKIKNYLGDGSDFGVVINYLVEETPLGTAGCLSKLHNEVKNDLLIVNGDVFCDINFLSLLDFHQQKKSDATVVVRKYEVKNPYGTIEFHKDIMLKIIEKPVYSSFINTGIYILSKKVIKLIGNNETIDMPNLLERIQIQNGKIHVFKTDEYWLDIGNPVDLSQIDAIII